PLEIESVAQHVDAEPLPAVRRSIGVPSRPLIEASRSRVAFKDPQGCEVIATASDVLDSVTEERATDALSNNRRIEIDRVDLARRAWRAVVPARAILGKTKNAARRFNHPDVLFRTLLCQSLSHTFF